MKNYILPKMAFVLAGTLVMGLGASVANAAEALWISAPNWSYSAAAAATPAGTAYFWGLSVGAGTYSFAYAYSHDAPFGTADAFAEASAGNLGGLCAVDAAGIADPFAGIGIDVPLTDPSTPADYPETKPASDPSSSSYTVDTTNDKITFTGSGEELDGDEELEAFVYNGNTTDASAIESELGAGSTPDSTSSSGDVTSFSALMADLGLEPLDAPVDDPSSLSELDFTENTADLHSNGDNIILVGIADAASTPTPAALPAGLVLLGLGGLGSLLRRRRVA